MQILGGGLPMNTMNKVYGCLFLVLLLCLATAADLLAYLAVGGAFFVVGVFVLGALLLLSVFSYGSKIGSLFSLGVFSITLLSGVVLARPLLPEHDALFGLIILSGVVGFVSNILCSSCSENCKKSCSNDTFESSTGTSNVSASNEKGIKISTYNVKNPEVSPLATMEALDDLEADDDDFVELKELENMMEKKSSKKVAKKQKKR